ncbi:hypothetical protein HDU81_001869, partial [Chytriomyces hyalinus]
WQHTIIQQVHSMIPENTKLYQWVSKPDPNVYLVYMLFMSRELESNNKKVLNPFPMRTSYIPGSITIDTSALIDILVHNNEFQQLKCYLEVQEGYHMEKIVNKGHLYDNPEKLIDNVGNAAKFKTSIWNYFVKDSSKL